MTDSLRNVSGVLEIMRRRLAKTPGSPQSSTTSQAASASPAGEAVSANEDIRQRSAAYLRSIDPAEAQRESKAIRYFLMSVLTSEFGEGIASTPEFHAALDEVQLQLEAEPQTKEMLARLISELEGT